MSAPVPPPAPPPLRARLRAAAMGAATALGLARKGWVIPYRYAGWMPRPAALPPYAEIAALFEAAEPAFRAILAGIEALSEDLAAIGNAPAPAPRWRQGWFPRLDAAAAYAIVRMRRPKRIVEIGSGHSTRFLLRAVRGGGLDTEITAIDPAPRAPLDPSVTHLARPLHEAGRGPFAALEPGDVLFVDSSHILMPGSDVDTVLARIWPALPEGVLVHFHDVFLPEPYPAQWAWRGYNEQCGVAALLAAGGAEPVFSSRYALTRMGVPARGSALAALPLLTGAVETSLWVRKCGRAPVGGPG